MLKRICESKKLTALKSDGARLLFTWLIPNVDVNGCFSGDPEVVRGKIFTRLKKSVQSVDNYLEDMVGVGLIARYNTSGDDYLHIVNFKEHQPYINPDREGKTDIPPPTPEQLQSNSGVTPPQIEVEREVKSKIKIEDFENFWSRYPRKAGKGKARESFQKISPDKELLVKILNAVEQQKKSEQWQKENGKYIPNPATWLNQGRWEDELPMRKKSRIEKLNEQRESRKKSEK